MTLWCALAKGVLVFPQFGPNENQGPNSCTNTYWRDIGGPWIRLQFSPSINGVTLVHPANPIGQGPGGPSVRRCSLVRMGDPQYDWDSLQKVVSNVWKCHGTIGMVVSYPPDQVMPVHTNMPKDHTVKLYLSGSGRRVEWQYVVIQDDDSIWADELTVSARSIKIAKEEVRKFLLRGTVRFRLAEFPAGPYVDTPRERFSVMGPMPVMDNLNE